MRAPDRRLIVPLLMCAVLFATAFPAAAQFGVGGRLAFVKADTEGDDDSVRFVGGHIRLAGDRTALEVSFDRRSETFDALDERVKETPIQVSLLLYLTRGGFKPYLLGGPGWYKRRVESIDSDDAVTTTKFGWHAGFGAEIRGGRHFGIHADYRYMHLSFDDDDEDEDDSNFITGILPSHKGSMWTVGATVYF